MKELAKISGLTFLVMFLIWACKPEKDQPSVQNEKNNMQAKASNNASWQGILSSNKSTFEPKMDTVRRALMGIMHDAQVTQIIKEFMNDNSSDSPFDFASL